MGSIPLCLPWPRATISDSLLLGVNSKEVGGNRLFLSRNGLILAVQLIKSDIGT